MAKINKHLVAIYIPVIVVVVVAVLVGSVVIAASSGGNDMHNTPPQYAATEPRAGDSTVQVAAQAAATNSPETTEPACEFSDLVGQSLKDLDVSAYSPRAIRVLHPGSMATMDYSPSRINIKVDDNEVIIEVTCG